MILRQAQDDGWWVSSVFRCDESVFYHTFPTRPLSRSGGESMNIYINQKFKRLHFWGGAFNK
ncbi:MAG: hypothetical protein IJV95_02980 [Clostridia bacterium]|nr:hypothetical protein [Clostridia bacterium]